MPGGRPPGFDLDPDDSAPVGQQTISFDSRSRLPIPTWMANGIGWLDPNSAGPRVALGIFNEPGRIKLVSWLDFSGSVIQRRREMVALGNLEIVKELDDRYRRLEIPSDLRVSLGESALVHLGIAGESGSRVYLYRVRDVFLIESARFRDQRITSSIPELADLP